MSLARHAFFIVTIASVALSVFPATAQQRYDRSYRSPHGTINVYEIPLRDREDYQPTYEEAARRKEDGYPLNNRELKALRRGPDRPKPGSIEETLLLRQQREVLKIEADSNIQQMEAGSRLGVGGTKEVIKTETDSDIQRMKTQNELELQRKKAELELELEYERKKQELKRGDAAKPKVSVVIEDVATTRSPK